MLTRTRGFRTATRGATVFFNRLLGIAATTRLSSIGCGNRFLQGSDGNGFLWWSIFQDGVLRWSYLVFPSPSQTLRRGIAATAGPTLLCGLATTSPSFARISFRRNRFRVAKGGQRNRQNGSAEGNQKRARNCLTPKNVFVSANRTEQRNSAFLPTKMPAKS